MRTSSERTQERGMAMLKARSAAQVSPELLDGLEDD